MSVRRTGQSGSASLLSATASESLGAGGRYTRDPETTQYRPGLVLDEATPPSVDECVRDIVTHAVPERRKAALLADVVAKPLSSAPKDFRSAPGTVPNVMPDATLEGLLQSDIAAESERIGRETRHERRDSAANKDEALTAARRRAHQEDVARAKILSLRGTEPRPEVAEFIASSDLYRDFVPSSYEVTLAMQTASRNATAHNSLLTKDKKKVQRCPYYPVDKHYDDGTIANAKKRPLSTVEKWANRLGLPAPQTGAAASDASTVPPLPDTAAVVGAQS